MSGVQAIRTLRRNEVVTTCADAPPQAGDGARVIKVPFLGGEATFVPGVIHLARSSGAPVLMVSVTRLADYRHQVVEISPPLSLEGEPEEAFARCAAAMDATIRTNPAQWNNWEEAEILADLGLIPRASAPQSTAVA
jgi:lauroyl/myristoyl acyltransferase